MRRLNDFIAFDHQAFLRGKRLVFKTGRYQNDEYFKGCKFDLAIATDETVYKDGTRGVNDFEILTVKMPDAEESYLLQFKQRMPVSLEIEKAVTYYPRNKDGSQSTMLALSITGKVRPMAQK